MTTELMKKEPVDIKAQLAFGRKLFNEIRTLVKLRPDRVIINGKQCLEFFDWQFIGGCFNTFAFVEWTKEITIDIPSKEVEGITFKKVIGFRARAQALKDGQVISAAESECRFDEKDQKGNMRWQNKPGSQVLGMAQTRACSRVLRQVFQWVIKYQPAGEQEFADESREELNFNGQGLQ